MNKTSLIKCESDDRPKFNSLDDVKSFLKLYTNENLDLKGGNWAQNPSSPVYSYELNFYLKKTSKAKLFIPGSKKGKINIFDYKGDLNTLGKILLSEGLLEGNNKNKIEELIESLFKAYNGDLIISDSNNLVFNENLVLISPTPKEIEKVEGIITGEYLNNFNNVILIVNITNTDKYLLFQIKHNGKTLKINYKNNNIGQELQKVLSDY
ncbi:MAG: hypothetical protein V3575_05855 [Candidatus Absconditabacteria bacterium]